MNQPIKPKVSIIVPIYGVERYILTCLQSIDVQTYNNIECILVNDCTKDKSMQLVHYFLEKKSLKPLVYKIVNHNQNKGLSAARNTGVQYASGDYIYFLDSDDYITENCIEDMINLAIEFDVDIVWGGIDRVNQGIHQYNHINSEHRIYNRNEILDMYSTQILYTEATNKLIRLTYLKTHKIEFVKDMLHEDVNWTFHLLAPHFKGVVLDKPTYTYIQREGSIMSRLTKKNYYAQIKNIGLIYETIKSYNLTNDFSYLKYFQYIIEYSIWMLFYRKSTLKERYDLYQKLRETNVNFKDIILKTKGYINFCNYHFNINNYNLAYILFEIQNTIRRIKNRIQK